VKKSVLLFLSLVCSVANADEKTIELTQPSGEKMSITALDNGEIWASFFLSDQTLEQFANNELIVLQIDEHKPHRLEHGLRSCATPASKPQQVAYHYEQDGSTNSWLFKGKKPFTASASNPLPWDQSPYISLVADRRPEVVDFPITRNTALYQQFKTGSAVRLRYFTTTGHNHEHVFALTPQQAYIDRILVD